MDENKMLIIKCSYWLGIIADGVWAIAFVIPSLYTRLTGKGEIAFTLELRLIMGIVASVYAGWTLLLIWALRKPIERRGVLLLTAIVLAGIFITALNSILNGNAISMWILVKICVLLILMLISYFLADRIAEQAKLSPNNIL